MSRQITEPNSNPDTRGSRDARVISVQLTMVKGSLLPQSSVGYMDSKGSFAKRSSSLAAHGSRRSEDLSGFAAAIRAAGSPFAIGSLPTSQAGARQASTCQFGLSANDASLKHARRRIRLARDFDEMLLNGFPNLSLDHADPELTLFISLTPKVASRKHSI